MFAGVRLGEEVELSFFTQLACLPESRPSAVELKTAEQLSPPPFIRFIASHAEC